MDKEIPSRRYINLTKEERDALYSLRDDSTIIIKGEEKGSVVVVWDREVYEEVPNDPSVLVDTIIKVLEKIRFAMLS